MQRFLAVILLGAAGALGFSCSLNAQVAPNQAPAPPAQAAPDGITPDTAALPPVPRGRTTILGGQIRYVDSVRDSLTLKVFGQKPVKILYDERTQVFRDGKKTPLRDLRPADHASVQTILDGTNIFAVSIHILSQSPEGDYQGTVVSYNYESTELTVSSSHSHVPLKLYVPNGTPVVREGQPSFRAGQQGLSDLVRGALVSVKFSPDKSGKGVASNIAILATPGAEFVFGGSITALDTAAGTLVVADPRDEKSYQISFNSAVLGATQNLHLGDHVTVSASYDGTRYLARAITPN